MASKIFFLRDFSKLKKATERLLESFYPPKAKILVKIHFGEPGNKNAFTVKDIKPIINALKSLNLKPVLIDTPVAYHSERGSVRGYSQHVKQKGFDKLAPFIISDRFKKIKAKDFTAHVCKELLEAKNVLVISHVKGHGCAGFGGAIKNFGMGGVMPETKQKEHDLSKPKFIRECQGCATCAKLCPAQAIKIVRGKAKIDLKTCHGCSICQLNCPHKVLAPKKALFDDLLAQGAAAVINNLPKKTFYINILKNISQYCDCHQDSGKIVSSDIGVLFETNPVAIDKASLDLVNKSAKKNLFLAVNHKDPFLQLEFARKYIQKPWQYRLVKI